jgi:P27 family predicted phage terminase small subunit
MKQPETTEDYKRVLRKACKDNGTYKKTDELIITNLAEIMSKRRTCEEEFEKTGGHSVIAKEGSIPRKNPILQTWIDLTSAALPYLRDLGLTPAARKKVIAEQENGGSALADLLKGV